MTPADVAKAIHNAITEVSNAYGTAVQMLVAETAALRANQETQFAKQRELAKRIQKNEEELEENAKKLSNMVGTAFEEGYEPAEGTKAKIAIYLVDKSVVGAKEDAIVVHLTPKQADQLLVRLQSQSPTALIKAIQNGLHRALVARAPK